MIPIRNSYGLVLALLLKCWDKMDQIIDYYILFKNHTDAMTLYQFARQRQIKVRISPTPRQASLCCGVSLVITEREIERMIDCMAETRAAYLKIVPLERQFNPWRDQFC